MYYCCKLQLYCKVKNVYLIIIKIIRFYTTSYDTTV